ncbi:MAG: chorismate lyase [Rhodoferax sp.]|nr:chorismate lyase [Rhodoferax sp.]
MIQWHRRNFGRGGLRRWLQAPGSLSARLAATGSQFSVQVLTQGHQALSVDEARALGQRQQRKGYAREVVLRVDGVARVFARSVTAHTDSLAAWRSVRGLGTRPLADVLFKRSGITRAPLAFAKLMPVNTLQRRVAASWQSATGSAVTARALSARRSVFVRRNATLLVMEVFVTDSWCWTPAAEKVKTSHRRRT